MWGTNQDHVMWPPHPWRQQEGGFQGEGGVWICVLWWGWNQRWSSSVCMEHTGTDGSSPGWHFPVSAVWTLCLRFMSVCLLSSHYVSGLCQYVWCVDIVSLVYVTMSDLLTLRLQFESVCLMCLHCVSSLCHCVWCVDIMSQVWVSMSAVFTLCLQFVSVCLVCPHFVSSLCQFVWCVHIMSPVCVSVCLLCSHYLSSLCQYAGSVHIMSPDYVSVSAVLRFMSPVCVSMSAVFTLCPQFVSVCLLSSHYVFSLC